MWDLSQNDEPTANVLMHIIIYSTVYEKKKKKRKKRKRKRKNVFVFVSVALDFRFIRATVKLLEKKDVTFYFGIRATIK